MPKLKSVVGLLLVIATGIVYSQVTQIEMDQDLMQAIDDTTKDANSNLSRQDAHATAADAQQLEDYFKQVESVFVQHGQADDGAALAKQAQQAAAELGKSAASNDFATAQTAARALTRTCKSCHDVYKSS